MKSWFWIAVILTGTAHAGVEGGNTDLFRPKNKRGEPILVTLGGEHPLQSTIATLIGKAKLPILLKNALLADLTGTTVLRSTEILTYKDGQTQLQFILTKVTRTTVRGPKGATETTQEEFVPEEAEVKTGVYLFPVNIAVQGLQDAYLAAYTEPASKRVVYFEPFLGQMSRDEIIELVLHEQAHRLPFLSAYQDNERMIVGWATALRRYLQGLMTPKEFYKILESMSLPTLEAESLPGEKVVDFSKDLYRSSINLTVNDKQLLFHGMRGGSYLLQVSEDAFEGYPILQGKQQELILGTILSQAHLDLVEGYLSHAFADQGAISLQLDVRYVKTPEKDASGRYRYAYSDVQVSVSNEAQRELIEQDLERIRLRHPSLKGFLHFPLEFPVTGVPEYLGALRSVIERIGTAMDELRTETPSLFQQLRNGPPLALKFEFGGPKVRFSAFDPYSVYSVFTILHFFDGPALGAISVASIKEEISQGFRGKPFQYTKDLETANRWLYNSQARVELGEGIEPLPLARAMAETTSLLERAACFARNLPRKEGVSLLHLQIEAAQSGSDTIEWEYGRHDDPYGQYESGPTIRPTIRILASPDLLKRNPRVVASAIYDWVLLHNPKMPKVSGGTLSWNPAKNLFQVKPMQGPFSGELSEAAKACERY